MIARYEGRIPALLLACCLGAAPFALAPPLSAQGEAGPGGEAETQEAEAEAQGFPGFEEDTLGIEEIIVTARKREESLQDIPISISAFSEADLSRAGTVGLEDIAALTTNLSYEGFSTAGNAGQPIIRGLSSNFATARIQNVGVFMDGLYLQQQGMFDPGLADVARVEVVKGPQNALYGRNAFAGAVNYVTRSPSEELSAEVTATLGSNERNDIKLFLSGPLFTDTLLAKASWAQSRFDGHTENDHPNAHVDVEGPSTHGNAGGYDNSTWSVGLDWLLIEDLAFSVSYYENEVEREMNPFYTLVGANAERAGYTTFNDLNCNRSVRSQVGPQPSPLTPQVTGNTLWCGKVPDRHPGAGKPNSIRTSNFTPAVEHANPDTREAGAMLVDPRGIGLVAESEIFVFHIEWDANPDLSINYLFGQVKYEGFSNGGAVDRDPLAGSNGYYAVDTSNLRDISGDDLTPYNLFSGRPISTLETTSHELRVDWSGWDRLALRGGFYYSAVEDEEYFKEWQAPLNGTASLSEAGRLYLVNPEDNPLVDLPFIKITSRESELRRAEPDASPAEHSAYKDTILALFGSVTYTHSETMRLTLEARWSQENKDIRRISPALNNFDRRVLCEIGASDACTAAVTQLERNQTGEERFDYWAPRAIFEYTPGFAFGDALLYASAAHGIKTGGFNNAVHPDQLAYDEETNWTFEIGGKFNLADNRVQLNLAAYMIDWTDMQVRETQLDLDGNPIVGSNFATGNIGGANALGIEIDGIFVLSDYLNLLFGFSQTRPEYDDGAVYQPGLRTIGCSTEPGAPLPCDPDTVGTDDVVGIAKIGGNTLSRTPEQQAYLGFDLDMPLAGNWRLFARGDANYQSEQYVSPLNAAWTDSRTLLNGTLGVARGPLELFFWGRNLTDLEYVGGVFQVNFINQNVVALGARRTYGITASYRF